MIVAVTITDNRETQIGDAIRSVVDHVDLVLLVDTGVTDRTVERAQETARGKLVVVQRKWVDFSDARNAGIITAQDLFAEWILILDSDERIDFGTVNLRKELAATKADVLLVESDSGLYPKQRFIRATSTARFFGPTHEALIGGSRALLRGITFSELFKTDEQIKRKLERDFGLLTDFVKKHPKDPRWHYYLGVTLEGLEQRKSAAESFGRCARLRKTGNEAAWACFKQAEQLFHLESFEEAITVAARGMAIDATFAECACIAAESALKLERPNQAAAWARIAEAVGRYKGFAPERLWSRDLPTLYERPYAVLRATLPDAPGRAQAELDFHAAKLARVRAIERIGDHDLDWISVSRTVPAMNREEARSMLRPAPLVNACPSARAAKIRFTPPGGRLPMNPSICYHNEKLWCVVRAVNYSMSGRKYTIHDPHGVVRTENYLGILQLDGRFDELTPVRDLDPTPRLPSQVVGYEDIRLVSIKGRSRNVLTGSATVCDRDPTRRLIARLHFNERGDVKRSEPQMTNQLHEKNWMPLSVDGEFAWIYSLDPTAILPGPLRACPFALDHLRGGAAIAFGRGYLCVMHEVIDTPETRIYVHRFVKLDKGFNVTAVSPGWVFAHHGIEFAAGLAHHRGQILVSYGIADREAWIMKIDAKEVEAMKWITS